MSTVKAITEELDLDVRKFAQEVKELADLEKNSKENAFFKEVWDSQKEFADIAVPFWSGAQMSNAKLGMAHAATLK